MPTLKRSISVKTDAFTFFQLVLAYSVVHIPSSVVDMSDISLNYKAVNLSASSQTDAKHSRGRRSISSEHTVELMIVADSKMAEYHGDKLETYVLSLIAVVIYRISRALFYMMSLSLHYFIIV